MNTTEVANRLVELLKTGQFEQAQKELFSDKVVSVEPESANIPEMSGLESILAKGEQFRDSVQDWHGITVSDPVITYNHFAIALKVELTFKGQEKSIMDEIILYKVEDGKIVSEQFFY